MTSPGPAAPIDPREALRALRLHCRSAVLATRSVEGEPDASYAPFAEDAGGAFLLLVSGLARHCGNLVRTGRASLMLIEDESGAASIFARRRATFACRVDPIARTSEAWHAEVNTLRQRHGALVDTLGGLGDFQLLRLVPESGTLVLGFGQAWRLVGPGCREVEAIGPR